MTPRSWADFPQHHKPHPFRQRIDPTDARCFACGLTADHTTHEGTMGHKRIEMEGGIRDRFWQDLHAYKPSLDTAGVCRCGKPQEAPIHFEDDAAAETAMDEAAPPAAPIKPRKKPGRPSNAELAARRVGSMVALADAAGRCLFVQR